MSDQRDGLGGTDSAEVVKLFPDKAGGPATSANNPKQAMIETLERLLLEVAGEKITGLAICAIFPSGDFVNGTVGQGSYTSIVGALDQLKFEVHSEHQRQFPRKPF